MTFRALSIVDGLRIAVSNTTDRLHGVRTEQSTSLESLGLAHPERLLYVPSSWKTMKVIARVLRPTRDDTFVDLGSGKGRVVMMAAMNHVLRRVVGVEISPELTAIAEQNLEAVRGRLRTPSVDLVTGDASTYQIPSDATIIYIYSSFVGQIFHSVIASIERRLDDFTGRRLVIVLQRPMNGKPRDQLLSTNDVYLREQPWLKEIGRVPSRSLTGWRAEFSFYSAK